MASQIPFYGSNTITGNVPKGVESVTIQFIEGDSVDIHTRRKRPLMKAKSRASLSTAMTDPTSTSTF